jgi:hypothetical protein
MAYQKPSQYTLIDLSIITHEDKTISIIEVVDTISIVEDIYMNFLHGSLVFADSNDLHQLAPLIGEETIKMVYKTDDATAPEVVRIFRTYRVETSADKYKDRLAHILYFCSEEAFHDANTVVSKSYKNKSIKFIISDAYKFLNTNKKFNIDTMAGNYHIISPNWTPFQLINYCTSISKPKNYTGSMVLFYENSEGYNFKHIEELMSQTSIGKWSAADGKNKDRSVIGDEIDPSNNIISYTILKNSVDTLKSMTEGLYNNVVISYDNVSKSVKTFGYDYDKEFDKSVHLAGFKLNSRNFELNSNNQRITYIPTTTFRYDSGYVKSKIGTNVLSERKETIIPSRTSMLSQISAKQIELEVAGDTRLVAGKIIDIKIPNVTALDSIKTNNHRYNNKKVLITSITNVFTQKTHKMILRVADDSYMEDLKSLSEFDEVSSNV